MANDIELGLETLLSAKKELNIGLDDNLIKQCFEIQKKHQFNHDRTLSTKAIDHLIESYVEEAVNRLKKEGNL